MTAKEKKMTQGLLKSSRKELESIESNLVNGEVSEEPAHVLWKVLNTMREYVDGIQLLIYAEYGSVGLEKRDGA